MGYFNKDKEIVITNVIGPGPKAIHGEVNFRPDHDWQIFEIEKIYMNSKKMFTYLGDWHFHPIPNEDLSIKDKRTLKRIASYDPARIENPIMGISYFTSTWKLSIWQFKKLKTSFLFEQNIYENLDIRYF